MAELLAFSPSSLLLSPQFQFRPLVRGQLLITRIQASPVCFSLIRPTNLPITYSKQKQHLTRVGVISDTRMPTTFTVDSAGGGIDILPDSGGSDDNIGGGGSGNGGGGGGNGGNDDNNKEGSDESENQSGGSEQKKGMSMSQKLTLGYATLVGIGGLMGFIKGGSQKSLISGGVSAALLYLVYTILPSNPVLASSLGLGLSASLLYVMGSRFKKSGKVFPAGVVSGVSLIMSLGYLHGIVRSAH